jgi:hypothetical protein
MTILVDSRSDQPDNSYQPNGQHIARAARRISKYQWERDLLFRVRMRIIFFRFLAISCESGLQQGSNPELRALGKGATNNKSLNCMSSLAAAGF